MTTHKIGARDEWLKARLNLLTAEKELTRPSDEVAWMRQELPWVRIDKQYQLDTDEGVASLDDLFRADAPSFSSTTSCSALTTLVTSQAAKSKPQWQSLSYSA